MIHNLPPETLIQFHVGAQVWLAGESPVHHALIRRLWDTNRESVQWSDEARQRMAKIAAAPRTVPPDVDLRLAVTEEDILHGKLNDCCRCPVARALDSALAEYTAADQDLITSFVNQRSMTAAGPAWLMAPVSLPEIQKFVSRFDNGLPVKPFTVGFRAAFTAR